jgi:alpha-ketoglutarate-dependent taurine dioxygenase
MRNTRFDIALLSGAGGAEISGVDVAQDLDDGTIADIREALTGHCVVFTGPFRRLLRRVQICGDKPV